ncbi:MAG: outer membrane beta-barrel protein [Bacteroidota bacterium]
MKTRIVSLILMILLSSGLYSQNIKGAGILGTNLTQVDGDEIYGFHKFGLNVGASAIIPINDNWSISLETLYSEKGSYRSQQYTPPKDGSYLLKLNYAEVPLLVHFEDRETMTFGLGASWGRLVKMEEYEHSHKIPWNTLSGPYDTDDFNFLVDIRFRIHKRLWGNARYAYSFAKIRTRDFEDVTGDKWQRDQYNNVITVRLIYIFNEELEVNENSK